jgi:hypothetical protein
MRERKRHKDAHGKQVNQGIRAAFKDDEQETCQECQDENPRRKGQAVTAQREQARQKLIARQQGGQAWLFGRPETGTPKVR